MLDPRSYPVDPYILFYKLEMAVLDSLLDNKAMTDDFEYFSLIGRGGSCTPDNRTPERQSIEPSPQNHRRAMSVKTKEPVSRVHSDSKDATVSEDDSEMRPRTNSMPSKNHLLRVRNFQTSGKKFENQGDTIKSASYCSLVSSSNSSDGHSDNEDYAAASTSEDGKALNTHRILLLGGEGCGKTTLTQQFLTSDDISGDDYLDDGKEKYGSVKVDGVESFLIFMDSDFDKNNYDPSSANAYIVVYSCTDQDSFTEAKGILKNLRHFEKTKAIILCGNKSDLVRKRQVPTEDGKHVAHKYGAKFIETSTMLNHGVDNLLLRILSEIQAREDKPTKASKKPNKGFRKSVKGLVGKIVHHGSGKKQRPATP